MATSNNELLRSTTIAMANESANRSAPHGDALCAADDGRRCSTWEKRDGPAQPHARRHHRRIDRDIQTDGRWLLRRAAGIATLILAVVGVVATSVGFSGWGFDRHHRAESGPAVVRAAPVPVKPKPAIAPDAMLNGQYQLTLEDSRSTYMNSSASQWSSGSVDHMGYIRFSTQCTASECVATSTPPNDPNSPESGNTVETLIWVAGGWSSRENPMPDGDGLDESKTVLYPDGRGGFRGTTTDTIISGPHAGAELAAPVVLTPRFDPANL